jgi:hypothetical protein
MVVLVLQYRILSNATKSRRAKCPLLGSVVSGIPIGLPVSSRLPETVSTYNGRFRLEPCWYEVDRYYFPPR